ncbi:inactive protein kinase SELMODRAFT_444075-like [Silene latifolia]|uniref:inactive protein kinase SELMODRAFT_444075-like n=1 Tax=Silene latifolia TaxID=37657 RepID=UPI003D781B9D
MQPSEFGSSRRLNPGDITAAQAAVIVAVKAERTVSKDALKWALSHVVRPGDCISLLAVFPDRPSGRRLWSFPRLTGNCAGIDGGNLPERISEISELCSQMALQFNNQIQVKVRVKVILGLPAGEVAAEAKRNGANWVILDKKLKEEQKHCIEKLTCSIVVMKGSQPQVLRLNLGYSDEPPTPFYSATSSPALDSSRLESFRMKHSTPISSPEYPSSSFSRTTGDTSLGTFDLPPSPFLLYEQNPLFERPNKEKETPIYSPVNSLEIGREKLITTSRSNRYDALGDLELQNHNKRALIPTSGRYSHESRSPASKLVVDNLFKQECDARSGILNIDKYHEVGEVNKPSIRDSVSISRTSSAPPPLCSICQHKTPSFGKPPRRFSYEELESATSGFSDSNLLAEGGFGIVHRGVLTDGQMVAVKQLKFVDYQGDVDFCREVRVLSCAQHRNVVLLIGFCLEDQHRVLVYEFICNSSLDFHLHSKHSASLDPKLRLKIALGVARGLRYLHEDCRVGCIIHRDMRPNNILLTHNFEPLVGDFGLARLHSEWNIGIEQQVIGASGYIAPEYIDGGTITEKVDVYSFGVVLMELITGKRIKDLQQDKELSSMTQIFDPLDTLQGNLNLKPGYSSKDAQDMPYEIEVMGHAACMCLRRNPECRPTMSKVLRILEGGNTPMPLGLDLNSVGSQSGHLQGLRPRRYSELRNCHSRKLSQ